MKFCVTALLTILYFLWLPIAFLERAFGRDPLQRKRPACSSYWLVRETRSTKQSYYTQHSENEGRATFRENNPAGPLVGARRSPALATVLRIVARAFSGTGKVDSSESHESITSS